MWPLLFIALKKRKYERGSSSYRGIARVIGYTVALTLGFGAFSMHSARGEVAKNSMRIGRSLMPLAKMLDREATIDIDGEHVTMGMGLTDDSLGTVLDKFENHCHENGVAGTWDLAAMKNLKNGPVIPDLGVIRSATDAEGVVLCFVKGKETADTLLGKWEKLEKTHDLGALGKARYAYAKVESGGKTSIVTLWTDDHLRIDRMMPTDTFEPGSDNPDLPRPLQSRRVLSGSVEGLPYAVRGYTSTATPREVLDRYDADMSSAGWKGLEHPEEALSRGYAREGVIVIATAVVRDGKTTVSLAEMGGQDPVRIGIESTKPMRIVEN